MKEKEQEQKLIISELKTKLRKNNLTKEQLTKLDNLFNDLPTTSETLITQLENIKEDLSKKLTQEEINQLYQLKAELDFYCHEVARYETYQTQIEIPPK